MIVGWQPNCAGWRRFHSHILQHFNASQWTTGRAVYRFFPRRTGGKWLAVHMPHRRSSPRRPSETPTGLERAAQTANASLQTPKVSGNLVTKRSFGGEQYAAASSWTFLRSGGVVDAAGFRQIRDVTLEAYFRSHLLSSTPHLRLLARRWSSTAIFYSCDHFVDRVTLLGTFMNPTC